jgi:DNA modification methylase
MPDVRLMLGDCVARMAELPAESVDLILTSPPYDGLRRYAAGSAFDFEATAGQCRRLLKPGGVLVWVVGDRTVDGSETGTSFRQALHFKAIGLNLRDTMIWKKANPFSGGDKKSHYRGEFEFMFVLSNGLPATINLLHEPCKTAGQIRNYTRQHGRAMPSKFVTTAESKVRGNVWEYAVGLRDHGHPAVFPLQLAVDHILSWTNPGDVVLDPFVGSGTTMLACLQTDRRGIGIDVSPEYLAIAERRLAAARAELPLFATA